MTNSDTKEPSEITVEKPKKKFFEKLNVKVKNNVSEFITIEPLLCIFLLRYLKRTLQEPYELKKVRRAKSSFCALFAKIRLNDSNNF